MKLFLVMILIGICAIGLRNPEILQTLGVAGAAQDSAISTSTMTARPTPMTALELAELSKTDPNAYQKFIDSHRQAPERAEVDKLVNFMAKGKFE